MQGLTTAQAVVNVIVPVGGLIVAGVSAYWAARLWRYQYITKEWWSLMQFLYAHAKYMHHENNENYKEKYDDREKIEYEIVARLCIAYLDDVYHLRLHEYHKDWLVGAIPCLAGPHRRWLEDNQAAYSKKFYEYLIDNLGARPQTSDGK